MVLISLVGAIAFLWSGRDLSLSYSIVLNITVAFYLLYKYSPDSTQIKLSFIYLLGFSLFICGRFFANILGSEETFCFDFGYKYFKKVVYCIKEWCKFARPKKWLKYVYNCKFSAIFNN